tara:strand:- start:317 stop:637 length:321 start_codon:yes stop_codon:yes gene_type:complete
MFLAILLGVANAGFDVAVKNKTSVEFEIYKDYKPYIANEITIGRSGFVLEDPNGVVTLNRNKVTVGIKYSDTDWITIDPHWYIQHSRNNKWTLQHGPELRFDARFW